MAHTLNEEVRAAVDEAFSVIARPHEENIAVMFVSVAAIDDAKADVVDRLSLQIARILEERSPDGV